MANFSSVPGDFGQPQLPAKQEEGKQEKSTVSRVVETRLGKETQESGISLHEKSIVQQQNLPIGETLSQKIVPRIPPENEIADAIGKLHVEGRLYSSYQEMAIVLTNPQLQDPEKQYLACFSPSDTDGVYLAIQDKGEVRMCRMLKTDFLTIWRLPSEQIHAAILHLVYETAITTMLLYQSLPEAKQVIEQALATGLDVKKMASSILTSIQQLPNLGRVWNVRAILSQLIDAPDSLQFVTDALNNYTNEAKRLFAEVITKQDLTHVYTAYEYISFTGLMPQDLLRETISDLAQSGQSPDALDFSKKVLTHFEALDQMRAQGIHRLSLLNMMHISMVAEQKFKEQQAMYVKKTDVGTAYSLYLDPAKRTVTVLLKGKEGQGPIKAAGGCAKVYSVIELSDKGAIHAVQKVNHNFVAAMSDSERKYEELFGGLRAVFTYQKYVNGQLITKCSMIKEAFECDLATRLERRPRLGLDEKIDILISLAEMLQKMHDAGVMHNDLKLANVLWRPGKCVLSDFGNSFEPQSMRPLSAYVGTYATPEFSAPEMLKNRALGPAFNQDVYAFGTLAFQLVQEESPAWLTLISQGIRGTGTPPVPSPESLQQALKKQQKIEVAIRHFQAKQASGPLTKQEAVDLAICRLLDPNPHTRSSLAAFIQELRNAKQL